MALQPVLGTTQLVRQERAQERTMHTVSSVFPVAISLLRCDSNIDSREQEIQTLPLQYMCACPLQSLPLSYGDCGC
jgi:hypothetical protein